MDRVENEGLDEFAGEGDPVVPPVAPKAAMVPVTGDVVAPRSLKLVLQRVLVALLLVLAYTGLVIGIWNRAVVSDRHRALASAGAPPQRSPAPVVSVPAIRIAIPEVSPAAPAPTQTATNEAQTATKPAPQLTKPAPQLTKPAAHLTKAARPVVRRLRAQPRTIVRPRSLAQLPIPPTQKASRLPLTTPSPSPAPSLAAAAAPSVIEPPAAPIREPSADPEREPPASAVAPVDPLAADRSAVVDVLAAYRKSYNNLDAEAASSVWDGVDERALRRAFSSLSQQHVSFDRCDVRVQAADRAAARCDGVLSYVAKVGNSSAQQRHMTWNMDLRRNGNRWKIVSVKTR